MAVHVQAKGYLFKVAQCHTINVGRVSHCVVTEEAFAKLHPDWQCKKCKKAQEIQEK